MCLEGFTKIDENDAGCVKSCAYDEAESDARCFNSSTPCEGEGCHCAQGRVLTLEGLCRPKRQEDDDDCGAESGANLIKSGKSYRCECPRGQFLSADKKACVSDCGAGQPWTIPFNDMKVCTAAALVCTDRMRCMCDHLNGYAVNAAGACESCNQGASFISSEYKCQS